jgi:FkbM family methyltransferase
MGAISSLDLFGLDELILFSFYWTNRSRYRRVLDLGANIGLHAVVLARCGMEVRSYEPDPLHFELLKRNLKINQCGSVQPMNAAVSTAAGEMEFVRVLGNTTGSHLAGSKSTVYGDIDRFPVRVEAFSAVLGWADLVKLDVEGHERAILVETTRPQWERVDAVVEIGSAQNADAVFHHFRQIGVNLFAQKIDWARVERREHMPESYRDGTLFISCKAAMPW